MEYNIRQSKHTQICNYNTKVFVCNWEAEIDFWLALAELQQTIRIRLEF